MKKLLFVPFVCALALLVSSFAPEQKVKWEKLGTRTVDIKGDHDVIQVGVFEGSFTKVRFKVMKAPIYLKNVVIVFGNGETKKVNFNARIKPGSISKVVDLPGNKRVIKKIKLNYKSVPNGKGKAIVSAWGRH